MGWKNHASQIQFGSFGLFKWTTKNILTVAFKVTEKKSVQSFNIKSILALIVKFHHGYETRNEKVHSSRNT